MEDRATFNLIAKIARDARRDLGANAGNGTKARPTVAQINHAIEALDRINSPARSAIASKLLDIDQ